MSWYAMASVGDNSSFVVCLKCNKKIEAYTRKRLDQKKRNHKSECRIARKVKA